MTLPLVRFVYNHFVLKQSDEPPFFDGTEEIEVSDADFEGEREREREYERERREREREYEEDERPRERYGEGEGKEEEWSFEDFSKVVQVIFTFIALGNVARLGNETFRYRTVDGYYDNGYMG